MLYFILFVFLIIIFVLYKDSTNKSIELNEIYSIFNNGKVVFFKWNNDDDWNVEYVSYNVNEILGYTKEEILSGDITYASLIHKDDLDRVTQELISNTKDNVNYFTHAPYRLIRHDAKEIWISDTTHIVRGKNDEILKYVGYIQDITTFILQEKELEKLLEISSKENLKHKSMIEEQSKLVAMGEMVGAIAHQWRQPLNDIAIRIQQLEFDYIDKKVDEAFIEEYISKNMKTIRFMSKTIDDFRGFFRVDKIKEKFDAKETINSTLSMLLVQFNDEKIIVNFSGESFMINGYESEFQQVILNILNNARDVLVENKTKYPTIRIELKEDIISICDNAGGIKEEIKSRIFEPYYTTKEQGKGTGMGLYMSKMIIEDNMGGNLSVKNVANGAMFIIDMKEVLV